MGIVIEKEFLLRRRAQRYAEIYKVSGVAQAARYLAAHVPRAERKELFPYIQKELNS